MSENYIVINGNKTELTKEQMEQLGIEIKPAKKERWRAEKGGVYFFVDYSNRVQHLVEIDDTVDNTLYRTHNYFKTVEEAEKYARVLDTELKLREFAESHNNYELDWENDNDAKWFLVYNYFTDRIITDWYWTYYSGRNVYFATEKIAEQAIAEIGEDKIKEYLTYEW